MIPAAFLLLEGRAIRRLRFLLCRARGDEAGPIRETFGEQDEFAGGLEGLEEFAFEDLYAEVGPDIGGRTVEGRTGLRHRGGQGIGIGPGVAVDIGLLQGPDDLAARGVGLGLVQIVGLADHDDLSVENDADRAFGGDFDGAAGHEETLAWLDVELEGHGEFRMEIGSGH
ncbi:MAG: hypothetical protein P0Y65_02265 [Candidatus Devosia phytovorans]|uniref:Uncharacterized protein n=1 Tax=Candidatus Devosia phytovorans TaxID=3121372 RepID=A0AAJ5VWB1_9HYPH|nr:hypothetical protein [Devosia sp.]WEK05100.1 MAG: hypothetical protein P0Y65_02265 [Devosia sp.]